MKIVEDPKKTCNSACPYFIDAHKAGKIIDTLVEEIKDMHSAVEAILRTLRGRASDDEQEKRELGGRDHES